MAVQHNNSVARAFAILEMFSESRPHLTAGDVARELSLNNVTAHRFLHSLEAAGALVPVSRGTYRLGHLFVDLARRVTSHQALAETAQPVLDWVAETLNESAMASVFEGGSVICLATTKPKRHLFVDLRPGMRLEAHCTSQGKVWLASLDDKALSRALDQMPLVGLTERTITDRALLEREIESVREQGYAINDGEREEGLRTIAVPVVGRDGRMITGLSVYGPASRINNEALEHAHAALTEAARKIVDALYGRSALQA
ncbi:IclR family transcriptional regulator [Breoghania corrubedonensis]|uniref:IclR family transcriptional regulator n=1 Tax=Breoghania corrubedonensis TaxID=665038 RepID=A0A2T5VB38_9HYPH|nr:IclR family transcriptional regulator C-terminal domain-containing protein [Breoghania corrubedonensis]PTW60970.1 IclR family transcriptional regulator [Breoghania corrubedonensis]